MKIPQLKFIISLKNDLEIYKGFVETAKFFDMEKDLQLGFYRFHPELEKIQKSNETQKKKYNLIDKYIFQAYQKDAKQMRSGLNEVKIVWQSIKKSFFKQTQNIFKNHKWPVGQYAAYATIWGIYPRFLRKKTFSFPYDSNDKDFISVVIMHEMLHFIFYEYAIKRYPKIFKKLDTENGIFWNLAEIFNIVILQTPDFAKLFNNKKKLVIFYPQHKEYFKHMSDLWRKSYDIDDWLIEGFNFLNKQK